MLADGRAQPINIEIPNGREGFGYACAKEEVISFRNSIKDAKQLSICNGFRDIMSSKYYYNQIQHRISVARRICYKLDLNAAVEKPVNIFFWPPEYIDSDLCSDNVNGETTSLELDNSDQTVKKDNICNELSKFNCEVTEENIKDVSFV